MGTRGPAPQPANIRVLKGNMKDRRPDGKKVARQPLAVPKAPPMPPDLGEYGQEAWESVVPELVRLGILGQIDGKMLEAWCRTYQVWRNHDGGHGYATLTMTFANLGSKLGLDPASRLRMTLPEAADGEEEDIFGADRAAV